MKNVFNKEQMNCQIVNGSARIHEPSGAKKISSNATTTGCARIKRNISIILLGITYLIAFFYEFDCEFNGLLDRLYCLTAEATDRPAAIIITFDLNILRIISGENFDFKYIFGGKYNASEFESTNTNTNNSDELLYGAHCPISNTFNFIDITKGLGKNVVSYIFGVCLITIFLAIDIEEKEVAIYTLYTFLLILILILAKYLVNNFCCCYCFERLSAAICIALLSYIIGLIEALSNAIVLIIFGAPYDVIYATNSNNIKSVIKSPNREFCMTSNSDIDRERLFEAPKIGSNILLKVNLGMLLHQQ